MINYREILEGLVNDANYYGKISNQPDGLRLVFDINKSNNPQLGVIGMPKCRITLYKGKFREFSKDFVFSPQLQLTDDIVNNKFNDLAKECLIHLLLVKSDLQSKIESGEIKSIW